MRSSFSLHPSSFPLAFWLLAADLADRLWTASRHLALWTIKMSARAEMRAAEKQERNRAGQRPRARDFMKTRKTQSSGSLHQPGRRRGPNRESLQWATQQLEQMAKEEADPKLRALWLTAAARGYELGAKPPTEKSSEPRGGAAQNTGGRDEI